MMGTRSGSIDPGILLHLLEQGLTLDALAGGLAHRSGLAAIAGTPSAREIEARAEAGDGPARLALAMFVHGAAAAIGSAATALTEVDALVFTGGIGEHSSGIRRRIVERLRTVSFHERPGPLDGDGVAAPGPPAVLVVEAREDLVIGAEVAALLGASNDRR